MAAGEYILPMLGKTWEQEYASDYDGTLHFHNYMEIGYCYHGKGRLIIEDRVYRYSDHMYSIIPSNVPHVTISDEGNICKWEFLFLDINSFIDREFGDSVFSADNMKRIVNKHGTLVSMAEHHKLGRIILNIIDECRKKEVYYRMNLDGSMKVLISELLRLDDECERILQEKSDTKEIRPALDYVEEHFRENIRIEDLSGICGLSESHFRRLFVQYMNMKPVDYLNMIRIRHACTLLQKEYLSMEEVGYRAGYQTSSTFIRNFRKFTGTTPYHWKQHTSEWDISDFHVTAMHEW